MIEVVRTGMCKDCTYVELSDSSKLFVDNVPEIYIHEIYIHCKYERFCERAYELGTKDRISEEAK